MTLTLRAVSLNAQPLTQPITALFGPAGGTIGRADHNTMALPDPERHISRRQAQIDADALGYTIRNIGSANRIGVGTRLLAEGEAAPLVHGDRVRIGDYLLEVSDDASSAGAAGPASRRADSATTQDPPQIVAVATEATRRRVRSPFDPARDAASRRDGAGIVAEPSRAPGVFDDLVPGPAQTASIDALFGLRATPRDALVDFLSDAPASRHEAPSAAPAPGESLDPLRRFAVDADHEGGAPAAHPFADAAPLLRTAFRPPPVPRRQDAVAAREPSAGDDAASADSDSDIAVTSGAVAADAPNRSRATEPPGSDSALWTAFCAGAGIELPLAPAERVAVLQRAGALLRAAATGTLQLVGVRAATRHELHAQVTMIQPDRNNPLKFSPDARAALEQLLRPPLRGFLPGPEAMIEAMHDLVGHAIGTMAGMRAALEGVLGRFAPEALEGRLAARSMLDHVLPANRRARLWELYRQHHAAIRDEAQDDFDALFGKAFLAAYEQQLERLRTEREEARST